MTLLLVFLLADCLLLLLPPQGQGPSYRIFERRTQCLTRVLPTWVLNTYFWLPSQLSFAGDLLWLVLPAQSPQYHPLCLTSSGWSHAVSTPGKQSCCGDKFASIPFWHTCVQWKIWPCVPRVARNGCLLGVAPTMRSCPWGTVVPAFTSQVGPILMGIRLVDSFVT